jgi:outer membrane protein OmpA-like peptidoglycan-associated protein
MDKLNQETPKISLEKKSQNTSRSVFGRKNFKNLLLVALILVSTFTTINFLQQRTNIKQHADVVLSQISPIYYCYGLAPNCNGLPTPPSSSVCPGLTVNIQIALDKVTVVPGNTITGTITYKNTCPVQYITIINLVSRSPNGTTLVNFLPPSGQTTLLPGQTAKVTATRAITTNDVSGTWTTYSTYVRADGALIQDPTTVSFTINNPKVPAPTGSLGQPCSATQLCTAPLTCGPNKTCVASSSGKIAAGGACQTTKKGDTVGNCGANLTCNVSTDKSTACTTKGTCKGICKAAVCNGLTVSKKITLNKTTVNYGQSISGSISYKNTCAVSYIAKTIEISARTSKNSIGGPFIPVLTNQTIKPGQVVNVTSSLTMSASDPAGVWEAFGAYASASGGFVIDNTLAKFTLSGTTAPLPANVTVHFDTSIGNNNGYTVRTVDMPALNNYAAALKKVPTAIVTLAGYTDNTQFAPGTPGPINNNQALSVARAQAVEVYLKSKGATANKYTVVGHGATNFIAPNGPNGNILNRRVVISAK